MADLLRIEHDGDVAVVHIERPPANAFSPELLDEGSELVDTLRADPPGAVVLTGLGEFFSGGVDLKLIPSLPAEEQSAMVPRINRIFCDWYGFQRPVIAAVNGHAVAGGLILALCADYRVGSEAGRYGITELRVGAPFPAAAIAIVKAELSPPVARRLVLGASLIDGATAKEWDVVDELLPGAQVLARSLEVAHEYANLPTTTYETVKDQLRGVALRRMLAESESDPFNAGWLSDETADAARAVIGPD